MTENTPFDSNTPTFIFQHGLNGVVVGDPASDTAGFVAVDLLDFVMEQTLRLTMMKLAIMAEAGGDPANLAPERLSEVFLIEGQSMMLREFTETIQHAENAGLRLAMGKPAHDDNGNATNPFAEDRAEREAAEFGASIPDDLSGFDF